MTKEDAYRYGFDCGYNGPSQINCDFRIFSSPENTAEWERGKKKGEIKYLDERLTRSEKQQKQ